MNSDESIIEQMLDVDLYESAQGNVHSAAGVTNVLLLQLIREVRELNTQFRYYREDRG